MSERGDRAREPRRAKASAANEPSKSISRQISAQVFGVSRPTRRSFLVIAALCALGLHLLLAGWARFGGPSLSGWGADLAVRVHSYLRQRERAQTRVDIEPKKKPQTPKAPPPKAPPPKAHRAAAKAAPSNRPPPRARAGRIISAKPDPNAPVNFADGFVTGDADRYAGGVTAPDGTSSRAVSGEPRRAAPTAKPHAARRRRRRRPNLKRRVSLADARWSCPWPAEADAERIDATSVLIRVQVAADGRVEQVKVIKDPGFGFGAAAKRCARRARFRPALGRDGKPVRSLSPPIRVRFSR